MILLAAFGASLLVGIVFAAGPCSVGIHKKNPWGILCLRCGAVVLSKRKGKS
jgi:hypothetical protein